ncbi:MAG: phage holin family protein [Muribaculaceae bacterium]|nr:phage holin family protein [Muribaculaceae bacterium]
MIRSILTTEKIYVFVGVFLAVSLLVIVAIILDLWDGVHTAKKTDERVHSHKLRVTIAKISEYWRFILIGFLVDCLGVFFSFYILPFVAVLFGAGLIAVEAKSMFEHANRRKSHAAELPDIVNSIIAAVNKKDAQQIIKRLKESSN